MLGEKIRLQEMCELMYMSELKGSFIIICQTRSKTEPRKQIVMEVCDDSGFHELV